MADKTHSFEANFKRAVSPIIVLAVLRKKPMYGYEISASIRQKSDGQYTVSIMYPILESLMEEGYIKEDRTMIVEGRARKYYAITDAGKEYLRKTLNEFAGLSEVFNCLTKEDKKDEEEKDPGD